MIPIYLALKQFQNIQKFTIIFLPIDPVPLQRGLGVNIIYFCL